MYTVSDVKELREKTGAGMMDCKKALEACEGSMDKAVDWLREKGIAKAAKKESRIAAEGLCKIKVEGNTAVMVEVNSETDFVAKNAEFTGFVDYLLDEILKNDVKTNEDVLAIKDGEETISDKLVALTAKIGEKLSFRRFEKVTKADDETFGTYTHLGGKIGTIIVVKGANEEVAKDVAMQAAAMSPVALTREGVPAEMVEHEREVVTEQVKNEAAGKPENIIEKMVNGRIDKFYKEIVLEEQAFIKENKLTVSKYVSDNGGEIKSMVRFAVGEGIEKRQENFADEVMSQINDASK
ncbi:MAG: translation elongation factor Ts [Mollicutes bacterium]|nr:translation elongation factor Ts [Mollicutes bacterium]MDY5874599.1 translation elongation factor Ts [Bacilli bacterium]